MKKISLIGFSLALVLCMGTLVSAGGTLNIDYAFDSLSIQQGSSEINFKGFNLRLSGNLDLNAKNSIEGNFIGGQMRTLADKSGNPVIVSRVYVRGGILGRYFGWNYKVLDRENTHLFLGPGYFFRIIDWEIYDETYQHPLRTTDACHFSGIVGKVGVVTTLNDNVKVTASLAWSPSIKNKENIRQISTGTEERIDISFETTGSILDTFVSLEYPFSKNFSIRGGFTMMRFSYKEMDAVTKLGGIFFGGVINW